MKYILSFSEINTRFKHDTTDIARLLSSIERVCSFRGKCIRESSEKILKCCNDLSPEASQQMTEGLRGILNSLAGRSVEVQALKTVLTDPKCVSAKSLSIAIKHRAMGCVSSQLIEELMDP